MTPTEIQRAAWYARKMEVAYNVRIEMKIECHGLEIIVTYGRSKGRLECRSCVSWEDVEFGGPSLLDLHIRDAAHRLDAERAKSRGELK
jgi:hypothetical protein